MIHRKKSVVTEAFYVTLAVTEDGAREVLGIFNMPQESVTSWGQSSIDSWNVASGKSG